MHACACVRVKGSNYVCTHVYKNIGHTYIDRIKFLLFYTRR